MPCLVKHKSADLETSDMIRFQVELRSQFDPVQNDQGIAELAYPHIQIETKNQCL